GHEVVVVEVHAVCADLGEQVDKIDRAERISHRPAERVPPDVANGPQSEREVVFRFGFVTVWHTGPLFSRRPVPACCTSHTGDRLRAPPDRSEIVKAIRWLRQVVPVPLMRFGNFPGIDGGEVLGTPPSRDDVAPDDEGEGGDEEEKESVTVGEVQPGLEHTDDAQHNARDDDLLNRVVDALRDAVVELACEQPDRADEEDDDRYEDQDEGDTGDDRVPDDHLLWH